jgi:hypothetical protein
VPDEVLLKGSGTFKPPPPVADYLAKKPKGGGVINVRFPGLAAGAIKVNERNGQYSTPSELQAIDLLHPALEPLQPIGIMPLLAVKVEKSRVTGFVTVSNGKKPIDSTGALIGKINKAKALGLLGLSDLRAMQQVNALKDGALTFKTDIAFKLGGFLVGKGSFGFTDDVVTFTANARERVKGLGEVSLDAERKPDGTIHGRAEMAVKLNDRFSGNLNVILAAGVVEISGTARYTTEKLTGEVSFIVTDAQTARTVAYQHLPPEALEGSAREAAGADAGGAAPTAAGPRPGPRAVAGWGTLDVHYNDWLTGQAMVVVDAEGQVTVVGKIALPGRREFTQTQLDYEKRIFAFEVHTVYGLPYVGNVGFFAGVALDAIARISPLVLSKIEIVGEYSTDPAIHKNFGLSANLNISALAMLRLRADAGLLVEILEHDIKVGAGVNAMAGVRGYVDATPRIGYRELADPKAGKRGEFYVHGEAELAAQPFLGLSGDLFVKLVTPWWSPISDHTWTWPLGQLEYPLHGDFGFGADIDYVLGSGKLPTISPKNPDFNADRFIGALMDKDVKSGSTGEQQKKGSWKEKLEAPPSPPAPPKVVDTKGKGTRKEPPATREDGKAWAAGMKAQAAMNKRGETRPYTAHELMPALREIKAKHGFSVLQPKMAGDNWEIAAARGKQSSKSTLKIKRAVGGVSAPTAGQAGAGAGPDHRTADQKSADARVAWERGTHSVSQRLAELEEQGASERMIRARLIAWKREFGFTSLSLQLTEGEWKIEGAMNPAGTVARVKRVPLGALKAQAGYDGLTYHLEESSQVIDPLVVRQRRATRVTGQLDDVRLSGDTRTGNLRSKRLAGHLPGDNAGHLIGHQFYGENYDRDNFVPMHPRTNAPKFYDAFERPMADWMRARRAEREAFLVELTVRAHYNDAPSRGRLRMRPISFTGQATGITGQRLRSGSVAIKREKIARLPPLDNPAP